MTWSSEIRNLDIGIRKRGAGQTAVVGRNPGGSKGGRGIDRYSVSGQIGILIRGDHLRELKLLAERGEDGCADQTGSVVDHEGHFRGRHGLGSNDEVAFVFAGEGIEDYNEFAIF